MLRRIVPIQSGNWVETDNGLWVFRRDPADTVEGIIVDEAITYAGLLAEIRLRYNLDVDVPIALAYTPPEFASTSEGISKTPVDITNDQEASIFMKCCQKLDGLAISVTLGAEQVAKYQFKRKADFVIGETSYTVDDNNLRMRNTNSNYRGIGDLTSTGFVEASADMLEQVYSQEDMLVIYRVNFEIEERIRRARAAIRDGSNFDLGSQTVPPPTEHQVLNPTALGTVAEQTSTPGTVLTFPNRREETNNQLTDEELDFSQVDLSFLNDSPTAPADSPQSPKETTPAFGQVNMPVLGDSQMQSPVANQADIAERQNSFPFNQSQGAGGDQDSASFWAGLLAAGFITGGELMDTEPLTMDSPIRLTQLPRPVEDVHMAEAAENEVEDISSTGSSNELRVIENNTKFCDSLVELGLLFGEPRGGQLQPRERPTEGVLALPGSFGAFNDSATLEDNNANRDVGPDMGNDENDTLPTNLKVTVRVSGEREVKVVDGMSNTPANLSSPSTETLGLVQTQASTNGTGNSSKVDLGLCLNYSARLGNTSMPIVLSDSEGDGSDLDVRENIGNQDIELGVGMRFDNREAFKLHIALHAMKQQFRYRTLRSRPSMMVIKCVGRCCPWRVYAVQIPDSLTFEIRRLCVEHKCNVDERRDYQRIATTNVIGHLMRGRYLCGNSGLRPNEIRTMMRLDHNIQITYWKAWFSRELAMDTSRGSAVTSYQLLPAYLHKLVKENPGTIVDLVVEEEDGVGKKFKYVFLAMGASIQGYNFMRKVVVIDGTHLKGKYAGCLLTACAQDGNYAIYPLAFAVVDGENDNSWEWFFRQLRKIVPQDSDLFFVSDRHSSILSAISKVYPDALHAACVLHLKRNIRTNFKKKQLGYLMKQAAYAFRLVEFNRYFAEIRKIDNRCAEYLRSIGLAFWARAHFPAARYNFMTSNISESWNAAIREARSLPILPLLDFVRTKLNDWFAERREKAQGEDEALTAKVEAIVANNFTAGAGSEVRKINTAVYHVVDKKGISFRVDLAEKTCTCYEFQHLQIPCCHAIAAAMKSNVLINSLIPAVYKRGNLKKAYQGNVNPVLELGDVSELDDSVRELYLHPPSTRRPPGRPRKRRFMSRGEYKMRGLRRTVVCKRCNGEGHNRATCRVAI